MTEWQYHVFGAQVNSDRQIPGLKESLFPTTSRLMTVELRSRPRSWFRQFLKNQSIKTANSWFQYEPTVAGIYVCWRGLFEFVVADQGRTVFYGFLNYGLNESFSHYFLSQILSVNFLQMGIETLHGASAYIDQQGVFIIGDSGFGKSTLVKYLLEQGGLLISDDLLLMIPGGLGFHCYAGPSRIKIAHHKKAPRHNFRVLEKMNPLTNKAIVEVPGVEAKGHPLMLKRIYVLSHPDHPSNQRFSIERVNGSGRLKSLLANVFNPFDESRERLSSQLIQFSCLAEEVPIKSLTYPRRLSSLPQVMDMIHSDLVH